MRLVACAALAVALLGGSCATRPGGPNRGAGGLEAAQFYPLAVGNRWTYRARLLGNVEEHTVEILREEDGFFVDSDRGRLKVDAYGLRDDKRYLLRDPLEPGKTWTTVVAVGSVEHSKILEVGQPCIVAAGTFDRCVTVEIRNRGDEHRTLINRTTFALGVGIARIQTTLDHDGKLIPQTDIQLLSYQLQPPSRPAGGGP
jgi:hypothetical protein